MPLTPSERWLIGAFGWVAIVVGAIVTIATKTHALILFGAGIPLILVGGYLCWVAVQGIDAGHRVEHEPGVLLIFERLYLFPLVALAGYGAFRVFTSGAYGPIRISVTLILSAVFTFLGAVAAGKVDLPDTSRAVAPVPVSPAADSSPADYN